MKWQQLLFQFWGIWNYELEYSLISIQDSKNLVVLNSQGVVNGIIS